MRFIKNDSSIIGKDRAIVVISERQICKEEVMIDYYYIGLLSALPRTRSD